MGNSEFKGKRVEIIRMEDPYSSLKSGDKGIVEGEDDLGHLLVKWDNGSSLSLLPEIDEYEISESNMKYLKIFKEYSVLLEEYRGDYDSSITEDDALEACFLISECQKIISPIVSNTKVYDDIVKKCEQRLIPYDKINRNFVLDILLYTDPSSDTSHLSEEIIKLGDKIMSYYGTEPRMVINAIEDCSSIIKNELGK